MTAETGTVILGAAGTYSHDTAGLQEKVCPWIVASYKDHGLRARELPEPDHAPSVRGAGAVLADGACLQELLEHRP